MFFMLSLLLLNKISGTAVCHPALLVIKMLNVLNVQNHVEYDFVRQLLPDRCWNIHIEIPFVKRDTPVAAVRFEISARDIGLEAVSSRLDMQVIADSQDISFHIICAKLKICR